MIDLHDPLTGRRVRHLTAPPGSHLHSYYDISPWSPDGTRLVYAAHAPASEPGRDAICTAGLGDGRRGGNARRIAADVAFTYHGACGE